MTDYEQATSPDEPMRSIAPDDLSPAHMYRLLSWTVIPRAIAWASTVDEQGTPNLAPFSFFTVASSNPPMLLISIEEKAGGNGEKDTLRNIRATNEFAVSIPRVAHAAAVKESSIGHAADVNEFSEAGLETVASEAIRAPRVGDSAVSFECTLEQMYSPGANVLVVGRIVRMHVAERLFDADDRIDVAQHDALGRVGSRYTSIALPLLNP